MTILLKFWLQSHLWWCYETFVQSTDKTDRITVGYAQNCFCSCALKIHNIPRFQQRSIRRHVHCLPYQDTSFLPFDQTFFNLYQQYRSLNRRFCAGPKSHEKAFNLGDEKYSLSNAISQWPPCFHSHYPKTLLNFRFIRHLWFSYKNGISQNPIFWK